MPQKFERLMLDLDGTLEDECKQISINCYWTVNSKAKNLTIIITCLKWTFNYDFCVRITAIPQRAPNVSKQIDLDDDHSLLRPLTDALSIYQVFHEPHLNKHRIEILGESIEYLDLKSDWKNLAHTHLAYPNLALD